MPRKRVKISYKKRALNNLRSALHAISGKPTSVYVGILEEDADKKKATIDGRESDVTLKEVGLWNEFGTSSIPSRPFVRGPFIETQGYKRLRMSIYRRLIRGMLTIHGAVDSSLLILGSSIAKIMRKRIKDATYEGNADATAESKGSETPLIATGQLLEHITFKIEK